MDNKILIVLNVDSDLHAGCYAQTGVKPSEWKEYLVCYIKDALKKRYGITIKNKKYIVRAKWTDETEDKRPKGYVEPDKDTLIVLRELINDAWHAFLGDKGFCG